jgi:hypothetical protein
MPFLPQIGQANCSEILPAWKNKGGFLKYPLPGFCFFEIGGKLAEKLRLRRCPAGRTYRTVNC